MCFRQQRKGATARLDVGKGLKMKILIIASYVALTTSSAFAADPIKVAPPQQKTISSQGGRFVFGQVSDFRSDQYMLDTQTGRLWQIVLRQPTGPDGAAVVGGCPLKC